MQLEDNESERLVNTRVFSSSVADLEALISQDGRIVYNYHAGAQQVLRKMTGEPLADFCCFIERARISALLDEVRNNVLRWAIALDKAGVRGEGLSFSDIEKERAHSIVFQGSSVTIGVLGEAGGQANVAAGFRPTAGSLDPNALMQLLSEIRLHTDDLNLPPTDSGSLKIALSEIEAASLSKAPDPGAVRQGLQRVLGFVGKAGQTVIVEGLKAYVDNWMRLHGLSN